MRKAPRAGAAAAELSELKALIRIAFLEEPGCTAQTIVGQSTAGRAHEGTRADSEVSYRHGVLRPWGEVIPARAAAPAIAIAPEFSTNFLIGLRITMRALYTCALSELALSWSSDGLATFTCSEQSRPEEAYAHAHTSPRAEQAGQGALRAPGDVDAARARAPVGSVGCV